MNLKSPSVRDHLQSVGYRVSIRDLLLRLSGHFIAEDTTKKSKIIYELLSEQIDRFVKINIKILINPKKLLINPKIFYSFFLLVTL